MRWNITSRIPWVHSGRKPRAFVSLSEVGPEEEVGERKEFGLPNRGETDLRRSDRFSGLAPANEAAETALQGMDLFKPPREPAP